MKRINKNVFALSVFLVLSVVAIAASPEVISVLAAPRAISSGSHGVALMFNVYQNTEDVEQIAEILDNYGVSASFFLGGVWAEKNRDMVFDLYLAGHDIGNHGYNHKLPTKVGADQTREEICRTDALITDITGEKAFLYAPPSGDYDSQTVDIAAEEGYLTILWSADTIDWRDQDPELILSRAQKRLSDGGFLLMHPTPATVAALPQIIDWAILQGYQIRSVSDMVLTTIEK